MPWMSDGLHQRRNQLEQSMHLRINLGFRIQVIQVGSKQKLRFDFCEGPPGNAQKPDKLPRRFARGTFRDVRRNRYRGTPDLGRERKLLVTRKAPGDAVDLACKRHRFLPCDEVAVAPHLCHARPPSPSLARHWSPVTRHCINTDSAPPCTVLP